jgi:predicted alpha/beta-fold hydrolase
MLEWLTCLLAPRIRDLTDAPPIALPDSASQDDLVARAAAAFDAMRGVVLRPRDDLGPYDVLLAMGCRDLVTREADQHPDTAGRTPTYAPFAAFEEVSIPGADGVMLHGRRSTGAPGAPVIVVVHGLYDSHTSRYVVEYAEVLRRWGFHVLALDMRDHGRLRGRPPPPSLGLHEGEDLYAAACTLSDAEGVSVGMLGISYGGQCAVRAAHAATQAGRPEVLRGGVLTLNAPLNVHEAVLSLDDDSRLPRPRGLRQRLITRGLRRIFSRHLRLRIREHGPFDHPVEDYEGYIRDVLLPAYPKDPPMVGSFLGAARSTQARVLGGLAVPLAILHSRDDMLVPVRHLRDADEAAGENPLVATFELPAGGHVGYGVLDPAGMMGLMASFFGLLRDG